MTQHGKKKLFCLFRKASREDVEDADRAPCTLSTSTKVVEHFLDQAMQLVLLIVLLLPWRLCAGQPPRATPVTYYVGRVL